jgi:DNA-directed RNA polymerase specialized sigma24 family protein
MKTDFCADYTPLMIQELLAHWELSSYSNVAWLPQQDADSSLDIQSLVASVFLDVRQALHRLPLRQRKAVFLTCIFGETEAHSAERLHISRTSLRERVHRGLANMAALLNDATHPLNVYGTVAELAPARPRVAEGMVRVHER